MAETHGSCLSFPVRVDERGSLATVSDPEEMARQFLTDLIETRIMERVLLLDYGTSDPAFAVVNAEWAEMLAYELEEQVRDYASIIASVKIESGLIDEGIFRAGFALDQQSAALRAIYTVRGSRSARSQIFPIWLLRGGLNSVTA